MKISKLQLRLLALSGIIGLLGACGGIPEEMSTPVNLSVTVSEGGILATDSGTINCKSSGGDCAENYAVVTDESFSAIANPGFYFAGWTECPGVDARCKLTLSSSLKGASDGLYTLSATFKPVQDAPKNAVYTYNSLGQRNSKTIEGKTTYFIYDTQGQLLAELDENGTSTRNNVYLGAELVASVTPAADADDLTYIHNDHQATPILATDKTGQVVWAIDQDAFGEARALYRRSDIGARFPGQIFDHETGFHYNYNRTYDPDSGRYLQSDPIGLDGGINTYAYVAGNPTNYTDFFGLLVDGTYNRTSGALTIRDMNTGVTLTGKFESGGNPWGDAIPKGHYDILSRNGRNGFFRLERLDDKYGDDRDDASGRARFRLHHPGRTTGCIAATDENNWNSIENLINSTSFDTVSVPSMSRNPFAPDIEKLIHFGRIEVHD